MKFFGLNLLTATLLLAQGMLSHGQGEQSYVIYSNGQTTMKVTIAFGQCTPVTRPDGSHMTNAYIIAPMRCYNFIDAHCIQMESPPFEDLPAGNDAVPPSASGASICYPLN